MNKNSLTEPELRFPSFAENWECSPISGKLKKVIDYRGKAPPKAERGIPLITARNVRDGYLDFSADEYIEENLYDSWMKRGIPNTDDILFTTEAPLGNVALFPAGKRYALGQRIITLQTKQSCCNSIFMFQLLRSETAKRQIDDRSTGTTAKGIKSKLFVKIPLYFPTLPEQQRIADFLTAVDARIQQLSQKKTLLETYKKGVMQQLFTQALRFKDDHGNEFPKWQEKKLGRVASFFKGSGIAKADVHEDGVLPCIRYGELYTDYAELISTVKSKTNVPEKELVLSRKNDVIIPASGETHIDIARAACVMHDRVALGGDINIMRTKENGVFLAYYLNNACKHAIARVAQGSSVIHLYPDQLKNLSLFLPSVPEQTKIANFLTALDDKIESVANQISHTQTFKKGLLQQMFV